MLYAVRDEYDAGKFCNDVIIGQSFGSEATLVRMGKVIENADMKSLRHTLIERDVIDTKTWNSA